MTNPPPIQRSHVKLDRSIEHLPDEAIPFYLRVRDLMGRVKLRNRPSTELTLAWHYERASLYLQMRRDRPDTFTGSPGHGAGGKMYLSEHMIDSEIVQGAWGLFQAYETHETRESFEFDGELIYGPHIDVQYLVEAAKHIAVRPPQEEPIQVAMGDVDRPLSEREL